MIASSISNEWPLKATISFFRTILGSSYGRLSVHRLIHLSVYLPVCWYILGSYFSQNRGFCANKSQRKLTKQTYQMHHCISIKGSFRMLVGQSICPSVVMSVCIFGFLLIHPSLIIFLCVLADYDLLDEMLVKYLLTFIDLFISFLVDLLDSWWTNSNNIFHFYDHFREGESDSSLWERCHFWGLKTLL